MVRTTKAATAATATAREAAAGPLAKMVQIEIINMEQIRITEMGPTVGAEKETVDKSIARNIRTPQ